MSESTPNQEQPEIKVDPENPVESILSQIDINKVTKELIDLYEQIAIKNKSSVVAQNLYDEKRGYLAQLMSDKIEIKEILKKTPNA